MDEFKKDSNFDSLDDLANFTLDPNTLELLNLEIEEEVSPQLQILVIEALNQEKEEEKKEIPFAPLYVSSQDLLATSLQKRTLPYSVPFAEFHKRENYQTTFSVDIKLAWIKQILGTIALDLAVNRQLATQPVKSHFTDQIHANLERFGFCIVETPTFGGIRESIHQEIEKLHPLFSSHTSGDFYGLVTNNRTLLNPILFMPLSQILLNNLVPTVTNLIKMHTPEYHSQQQWFTSIHFPLVKMASSDDTEGKSNKKRGRPRLDPIEGGDMDKALYFSPYFTEYYKTIQYAEQQRTLSENIKYPNEIEHLQIITALSPGMNNSFRLVAGMHKFFDILVDLLIHDTSAIQPLYNGYYRLPESWMTTLLGSFIINIEIPVGCTAIINPKMALGRVFTTSCSFLPFSIWPKPLNTTTQIRYTEQKTWQVSIPSEAMLANGFYYEKTRRGYFRNIEKGCIPFKDETILAKFTAMAEYHFNKVLENYAVYGYPFSFNYELMQEQIQSYLATIVTFQAQYHTIRDTIHKLSPQTRVGLVTHLPTCQFCGDFKVALLNIILETDNCSTQINSICLDCCYSLKQ